MGYVQSLPIPVTNETSRTLVGLLLLCSALLFFIQKWKNRHLEKLGSKFTGPIALPIIGNAMEFIDMHPEKMLATFVKLCDRYESPFRFWLGSKLCIVIGKPEDLQIVLNSSKTLEKDEIYRFLRRSAGTGLATAPVEKWKKTRKAIAPAFTPKLLDQFLPIMNERNAILIQKIQQHCGSGVEINIFPYFSCMALDTFCQTGLGVKMNTQLDQNSDFAAALARAAELQAERIYKPWLHPDFVYDRLSHAKELDEVNRTLREFAKKVIQIKKKEYDESKNLSPKKYDNESDADKKLKMFIDILFELKDQGIHGFSETDMIDEALTFVLAASDTSVVTNCFCLLFLAMYPEIQDKVFEEQYRIFGEEKRPVTPEDLLKMEYTEQAIRETLRMFPPVPLQLRAVTEDTKITGGLVLPAGATVVVAPLVTHRDPALWPEPQKFNPDNFSAINLEKKHKYSFLAFSGGSRGCIGSRYAMMSMKTTISTFIRQYEVKTTTKLEDIKISMDVFVRSSNGWNMRLDPRTYPKSK